VQSTDCTKKGGITLILLQVEQLTQTKVYYSNWSLRLSAEYLVFQEPSKEGFLMFQLALWYTVESWFPLEAESYAQFFVQIFLAISLIHFSFQSISLLGLCEFRWNDSPQLRGHFRAMHLGIRCFFASTHWPAMLSLGEVLIVLQWARSKEILVNSKLALWLIRCSLDLTRNCWFCGVHCARLCIQGIMAQCIRGECICWLWRILCE